MSRFYECDSIAVESAMVEALPVTEGLMDKAKELKEKFDKNIRPKIEAVLKWIREKIKMICDKLNIFNDIKFKPLHLDPNDNRSLNELSKGFKDAIKLASTESDKVDDSIEKISTLIDSLEDSNPPVKSMKPKELRKWMEELQKFGKELLEYHNELTDILNKDMTNLNAVVKISNQITHATMLIGSEVEYILRILVKEVPDEDSWKRMMKD